MLSAAAWHPPSLPAGTHLLLPGGWGSWALPSPRPQGLSLAVSEPRKSFLPAGPTLLSSVSSYFPWSVLMVSGHLPLKAWRGCAVRTPEAAGHQEPRAGSREPPFLNFPAPPPTHPSILCQISNLESACCLKLGHGVLRFT